MIMKDHLLAGLQDQIDRWETLLDGLAEGQLVIPHLPSKWTIKDEVAHLAAWQLRSIARLEAALADREPQFPVWLPGVEADTEANTDLINDWLYETYRLQPWSEVHKNWREGYSRFIDLGKKFLEKDLMDESRYSWMKGRPLALVLLASYDHHQEHYDKMLVWFSQQGEPKPIH